MAKNITSGAITVSKKASSLNDIFSKISHVYFDAQPVTDLAAASAELELPVLEGSVSFDTGSIDKTEIKLLDGTVWTSSETKGDSSITMQVASLSEDIVSLFCTKQSTYSGVAIDGVTGFSGAGWGLDIKKTTGSLVMTDATGKSACILTNVEMTGSLVLGDGDNPAYFNVSVTPKPNADGESVIILNK